MSYALCTTGQRLLLKAPTAGRVRPQTRRSLQQATTRCMASEVKLDKSTPEDKWRELLSAEEVSLRRAR